MAYIIIAKDCATPQKCDGVTPTQLSGIKVDRQGKPLVVRKYDTSRNGLGLYRYSSAGASMAWNTADNTLGLVLSKLNLKSGDGLNHQGATALVLDGKDMSIIHYRGGTSSHSFANSLHVSEKGKFLGADLGDNFPRGINLFEFSKASSKRSKLAYHFKTRHCTKGNCFGENIPEYKEISTPTETFFKQSNDNRV